jgi:hypothetical protein
MLYPRSRLDQALIPPYLELKCFFKLFKKGGNQIRREPERLDQWLDCMCSDLIQRDERPPLAHAREGLLRSKNIQGEPMVLTIL